ncbi:MAG: class I SAM-dependent methyltransferase [Thermoanaerobaculia bacterium]|nr:class I SAM-dependent methyltransferase [Thermoanaerobaculia bacterium]
MTWYQEWFGEEYLDLYSHRDEEEARSHIEFFRKQVGSVDGMVLDLACGSGRHLMELESAGYSAVGFDLSATLLAEASRRAGNLRLVRADMRFLPFDDRQFAALVNFFTSFGYFDTEEENLQVVGEMARVMANGAPFLFDYLNVAREQNRLVDHEIREADGRRIEIDRWFNESTRVFNKRIRIDGRSYLERVRGYDLDEITMMFSSAGFSIRSVLGDFDGQPFSPSSPRLILVGKRTR